MTGAPATGTFFRSRWVERPAGVRELDAGALPAGFRAAGVACGIKRSGGIDLGLIVSDEKRTTSAARFTRNAVVAAPVTVSRRADLGRLRAVVANSGNANVWGGEPGIAVAETMAARVAAGLGVDRASVGVASTGVIGVGLQREAVVAGIEQALGALSGKGGAGFAQAILTTDRGPKQAGLELSLSDGVVRVCAQAKGAGMISPAFATMLCFIETDAALDAVTIDRMLGSAVGRSFERITVDGQLSTNDSVFMLASGASGQAVEPGSDDEWRFAEVLDALLRQLALEIVADGEGATRVARLVVRGSAGAVEPVARAVANSPLVKCALAGADPNWGRILQAAGQAVRDAGSPAVDVFIEDVRVAGARSAVALGAEQRSEIESAMAASEVDLKLQFPDGDDEVELYFCDLGHDYVTLNSQYVT